MTAHLPVSKTANLRPMARQAAAHVKLAKKQASDRAEIETERAKLRAASEIHAAEMEQQRLADLAAKDLQTSEALFRQNLRGHGPWLFVSTTIDGMAAEIAALRSEVAALRDAATRKGVRT